MFGFDTIAGVAGGLLGGGKGGAAPSSARGSQDGNAFTSGRTGGFTVGGPSPWFIGGAVVAVLALLYWLTKRQ